MSETYDHEIKRLRDVIRTSRTGALAVALEIEKMAGEWDEKWRDAAGGDDAALAIHSAFSITLDTFRRWARAVELCGKDVRSWAEAALVVRMAGLLPAQREAVKATLLESFRVQRRKGNPVRLTQARGVIARVIGAKPRAKTPCSECARLRKQVERLEALVQEDRSSPNTKKKAKSREGARADAE